MPDPDEVVQSQVDLAAAVRKVDSEIPPAIEKLKAAAGATVDQALELARASRRQSGSMRAVVPPAPRRPDEEPPPPGDLTAKFRALK